MRNTIKVAATVLAVAAATSAAQAKELYGVTTTTWEEGNARVVSVNLDNLSTDAENPTPFTEISTFEHASDFMAGTWAKNKYYCYYNTYNQELDLSLQFFGTLNMTTGEFTQIAEENHVTSDNVTDMMDMTYDPVGGGLLGLDRQYIPSQTTFGSTIQNISKNRGTLSEVTVLDKKYSGFCSDGNGGFYLAEIVKTGEEEYTPYFYKSDDRFNVTPFAVAGEMDAQSSFAHSLTLDGDNLYLASGSVLTIVNLTDLSGVSYYLEKDLYGITFDVEEGSGVSGISADTERPAEYFTLDGIRVENPTEGRMVICRKGTEVKKMIIR